MNYLDDVLQIAPDVPRVQTNQGVGHLFGIVLNVLVGVGVSISVIYIGLAGIRFMTSQGDPKATAQARQALTYSIVALVLSVGALAIKTIILDIAGVTDPNLIGGTPTF